MNGAAVTTVKVFFSIETVKIMMINKLGWVYFQIVPRKNYKSQEYRNIFLYQCSFFFSFRYVRVLNWGRTVRFCTLISSIVGKKLSTTNK